MKVIATQAGFFGGVRRREGDVFVVGEDDAAGWFRSVESQPDIEAARAEIKDKAKATAKAQGEGVAKAKKDAVDKAKGEATAEAKATAAAKAEAGATAEVAADDLV